MRLFDLHCDTLTECYDKGENLLENHRHVDLARGGKLEAWAQLFAVWMPDSLRGEAAFDRCCAVLDFAREQAGRYPGRLGIVEDAAGLRDTLDSGRCAGILTVEGASALAGDLRHLEDLAARGVKLITITWNGSNELGHGCLSGCPDGLTPFGKRAVRRMEELSILPDVSHLNEAGFWDVAETAAGPFLASHSVSAALCSSPRNLDDRQFAAIRDRGGLVGINFCAGQLGEQTFEAIERHLDHYLSLEGGLTVAFGADLDGTDLPHGWGGIQVMERLYDYLCRKNYDAVCLDRVFFGNCYDFFLRALTKAADIE